MARLTTAVFLSLTLLAAGANWAAPSPAAAQDARQRQAAAEAYDRGTAAYLDGDYTEAAQWFETANRMAPAAPALMQAVRAHQRAEHFARAATLALRLQQDYSSEPAAAEYAASVLKDLAPQFVQVEVTCDQDCKLDLDGKLQEFHSFFLEPGTKHSVVANFDTGSQTEEVQGEAGTTRNLTFTAPPPPADQPTVGPGVEKPEPGTEESKKPLPPIVTYVGAGVTGVLLIGAVLSGVDTNSGTDAYEKSAMAATKCGGEMDPGCPPLYAKARKQLSDGQAKETRTNILVAATAVVAVGTGVIALFFTDWSSDSDDEAPDSEAATLRLAPTLGGVYGMLEGHF